MSEALRSPGAAGAALWRSRLTRFALGGGVTVVSAAFAAVRNRWLGEHLSTAGVGVLAQVTSAQTWLATLAGMGLVLPVARAVAVGAAAGDMTAVRRTIWTALALVGSAVAVVVAVCLSVAPWASTLLLGTDAHAGLVRISMVGVAAASFYVVVSGLFIGRSDVGGPMIVAFAGGVASLAATLVLVPRAGLVGGAVGIAVLMPAALAAAIWARRRRHRDALLPAPRPRFNPATARSLLSVGFAALLLSLLEQGTMLGLRAHYLRLHGISSNGLLQAGMALAQQVSAMFIAYLVGYAFGRISGAGDTTRIRDYTQRHWVPLVALAALAFSLAMLGSAPLLALFYSDPFTAARPLMAWALFAEFCRVMAQVWSLGALPLGALRAWIAIGVANPLALAVAYSALTPVAGPLALPLAAAAGSLAQLVLAAVLMSRRGITPSANGALILAAALVGLAMLARTVAR